MFITNFNINFTPSDAQFKFPQTLLKDFVSVVKVSL
jgi:hypothetical protein